jgi:5-formyltetrahydrofolate cyclo-ligase
MQMLSKSHLRKRMIQLRNQLSPAYREECSQAINRILTTTSFFQQAETILFYMAFQSEVDVSIAMQVAWGLEKRVVLPKVNLADRMLSCFEIRCEEECVVGEYGIREPLAQLGRRVKPAEIDLVVVPGVAFDRLGYRLGYGAGYYDRFFARSSASQVRMGVAYPEQVVETVYPEAHDVVVHALITANNGGAQVTSQLP